MAACERKSTSTPTTIRRKLRRPEPVRFPKQCTVRGRAAVDPELWKRGKMAQTDGGQPRAEVLRPGRLPRCPGGETTRKLRPHLFGAAAAIRSVLGAASKVLTACQHLRAGGCALPRDVQVPVRLARCARGARLSGSGCARETRELGRGGRRRGSVDPREPTDRGGAPRAGRCELSRACAARPFHRSRGPIRGSADRARPTRSRRGPIRSRGTRSQDARARRAPRARR